VSLSELTAKYHRTERLDKRRPILSEIATKFGRDKAAAVCRAEDVSWLSWYYWEIPSGHKDKIPITLDKYVKKGAKP
jgi:hypothetical protein